MQHFIFGLNCFAPLTWINLCCQRVSFIHIFFSFGIYACTYYVFSCRKFNNRCNSKILIHSDVTQAIGKMKVELNDLKVDFISLSGHKFYGPRCGALVLRSENTTPLFAFLHGGGQERGMRGG